MNANEEKAKIVGIGWILVISCWAILFIFFPNGGVVGILSIIPLIAIIGGVLLLMYALFHGIFLLSLKYIWLNIFSKSHQAKNQIRYNNLPTTTAPQKPTISNNVTTPDIIQNLPADQKQFNSLVLDTFQKHHEKINDLSNKQKEHGNRLDSLEEKFKGFQKFDDDVDDDSPFS